MKASVVLAAPSDAFARSLSRFLLSRAWVERLNVVSSLAEAIALCESTCPDVLVIDLRLLRGLSKDAFWDFRRRCPQLQIIGCSLDVEEAHNAAAQQAGFDALVRKDRITLDLAGLMRTSGGRRTKGFEGVVGIG